MIPSSAFGTLLCCGMVEIRVLTLILMRVCVILSPVIVSSSMRSSSPARRYCRSVSPNVSSATSPGIRSATSHCIDILRNGIIICSKWSHRLQPLLRVFEILSNFDCISRSLTLACLCQIQGDL